MNTKNAFVFYRGVTVRVSCIEQFTVGMFISVIFPNRQLTLVNRLLTVNRQDYFKLELN